MEKPVRHIILTLVVLVAVCAVPQAKAQGPVIAPEVEQAINEQGIDVANARFAELLQSGSLDYTMESQALMALMTDYMQSGNNDAASAVGEMYAQLMQQMLSGPDAYPPGMAEAMREAQKAEEAQKAADQAAAETEQQQQQQQLAQSRGKSREDLDRFKGLYSDPDSDDTGRSIFVTVSCDGYLVTGAMWGDVSPWWMRSAGDNVFTYADSWTNLSMEFVGDGGLGTQLKHDINGVVSPLENKRPLPDDWPECMERPIR